MREEEEGVNEGEDFEVVILRVLLIWSLCVKKIAGDVVVDTSNDISILSVVVSGVVVGDLGFTGSGRGRGGDKGRPLGLLMIRLRCPILLREFQGL